MIPTYSAIARADLPPEDDHLEEDGSVELGQLGCGQVRMIDIVIGILFLRLRAVERWNILDIHRVV
jgi:hypothetical protein